MGVATRRPFFVAIADFFINPVRLRHVGPDRGPAVLTLKYLERANEHRLEAGQEP
ncbi:hypothetical protein V1280_005288 [Bradyrhizobium sp. AZCC 2230]